jgi:F-type H+-transporting ATPase subunit b
VIKCLSAGIFLLLLIAATMARAETARTGEIAHGAEKDVHAIAHPHEGNGKGTEEPETTWGIPTWIFKLANMIVFIGVLVYFLKGPVTGAFRARHESVRAATEEAKARRKKSDDLAADIQARLGQIEQEVAAIVERARQEGEHQRVELVAAAGAESRKILLAAKNEVENRLKAARTELTQYAGELAADRAEQILRSSITEGDQKKLFQDSLSEIGEVRS